MLWSADGRGGGGWPSHALLHVLQGRILLLLPLTLLLVLQLVTHQLEKTQCREVKLQKGLEPVLVVSVPVRGQPVIMGGRSTRGAVFYLHTQTNA